MQFYFGQGKDEIAFILAGSCSFRMSSRILTARFPPTGPTWFPGIGPSSKSINGLGTINCASVACVARPRLQVRSVSTAHSRRGGEGMQVCVADVNGVLAMPACRRRGTSTAIFFRTLFVRSRQIGRKSLIRWRSLRGCSAHRVPRRCAAGLWPSKLAPSKFVEPYGFESLPQVEYAAARPAQAPRGEVALPTGFEPVLQP